MARGGSRQGTPGEAYSNRTDLMVKPRNPEATPAPGPTGPVPVPAGPPLVPSVPFNAPTQRPGEHVMAGAPLGPGPGPVEAGMTPAGPRDLVLEQLKAYYAAHPNPDLGDFIENLMAGDYASGGRYGRSLL